MLSIKYLMLRSARRARLEARTTPVQPIRRRLLDSFTSSEERSTGARLEGCGTALTGVFPQPALMFAFKGSDATICSAVAEEVGSEVRTAGDGTRRRRLNKLSCAGWVPHDRGSVSGLPHSRNERRSGDRLITGQEGSPPWSCLRQCAPLDLLCSASFPPVRSVGSSIRRERAGRCERLPR